VFEVVDSPAVSPPFMLNVLEVVDSPTESPKCVTT
jgi:hypothetical protein